MHTATGAQIGASRPGGASREAAAGEAAAARPARIRRPAAPEAPDEVSATLSVRHAPVSCGISRSGDSPMSFRGQASSAQLKLEMQTMGVIYTDFQSCVNFLKVRVPARAVPADPESHTLTSQSELNPDDIKATSAMMQGFDFHPEEWQQYSNYQAVFADNAGGSAPAPGRNQALIAHDDKFSLARAPRRLILGRVRWELTLPRLLSGPDEMGCGAHRPAVSSVWVQVLGEGA